MDSTALPQSSEPRATLRACRAGVRLALLFFATLRALQDVGRGVWTLPVDFRALHRFRDAMQQVVDEHCRRKWTWQSPHLRVDGVGRRPPKC